MEYFGNKVLPAERLPAVYRNRIRMNGLDELVIVTEGKGTDGKVVQIGVTKARRRL